MGNELSPARVQHYLRVRHFTVHHATRLQPRDDGSPVIAVFLEEHLCQWEDAIEVVARMPGVADAVCSDASEAILHVTGRPPHRDRRGRPPLRSPAVP